MKCPSVNLCLAPGSVSQDVFHKIGILYLKTLLFEKQKRMSLNPKPNFLFWAQVGFCTIFFLQFTKDYEFKLIYET